MKSKMKPSSRLLVGAAALFSLASAIPHQLLTSRQTCPDGKVFYVCQINNFRGCCSIDPCAIEAGCPENSSPVATPPPSTLPPTPPAAVPSASPSASSSAVPTCKPGTKAFRQYNPTMRTIGVANSDPSLFKITNITSQNTDISQVFSFSNIPPTAQNIALKWFISTTVPEFSTKDTATGGVFLLDSSKLPSAGTLLTTEAVMAAIDKSVPDFVNGAVGGAGFGFWDLPDFPKPHDHVVSVPKLPARSTLSFLIGIKDQGEVVIRQTQKDGFYLSYDC